MRSGVSEGRSEPRVVKVLLFVIVFAGIPSPLPLRVSMVRSLESGTPVIYTIYYIIVKYIERETVANVGEGRAEDGREAGRKEELRPVLHGGQGARRGGGAVDAVVGARALYRTEAVQGSSRGFAGDRVEPPRRQAQDARGAGDPPARHVASARGVQRLRANGAREVAGARDRGPLTLGGEAVGRAARGGGPEGGLGRRGDQVGHRRGGRGRRPFYLRVPYRRRGLPRARWRRRGRGEGGGQAGPGPGSRPGRRGRRGEFPCGGLRKA